MDDPSQQRTPRSRHPAERGGHQPDLHALRTPLTVVMLRAQMLRRHLRRGDDPSALEAELDQIDATLAQLAQSIDELDRAGRDGRHGWP